MKKFRLAVLAAVVCTAALLTSCIKEESYEVDMAQLDVTFDTRADEEDTSGSQQQGDGIKDVMLWAFKCTLNDDDTLKTVDEDTATGWRHVQNVNANGSLTNIHLPLPICGDGTSPTASQSYVVVAVINTEQFGTTDIGGFSRATTYTQLTEGTFDASGTLFWKYRPDDEDLVPEDMPVSSWATITVTNANTHADNCLALTLPTYRAVAKVQLNMNKSNDNFGVVVTDVKIKSNSAPNRGCILSKSSQVPSTGDAKRLCYPNQTAGPQWWVTPTTAAAEIQLANSPEIESDTEGITSVSSSFFPTGASYDADPTVYSPIGSAFLYENNAEPVDAGTEYDQEPTSGDGYYMEITYVFNRQCDTDGMLDTDGKFIVDLEGNEKPVTRYVPLPKIVRNHDYRVNATVSVNVNGYLIVNYKVTEWETASVDVPSFN
ncbi:MAG: hypothetical protein IJB63_02350 [Alistipes sp.]|nr:hypothetical protein [Alistipes sp.]